MKRTILLPLLLSLFAFTLTAQPQKSDRSFFIESKNEFMDKVKKELKDAKPKDEKKKEFKMDFSGIDLPKNPSEFKQFFHNPPISQGISGMCWCYSTTSFFESEIFRLTQRKIKLSELHTVYWEFIEKAVRFVHERGKSEFAEGSESNAVSRIWKKYGAVPAESYTGLLNGQQHHDHSAIYEEMNNFLTSLKTSNNWNEEAAVANIKSILDHYLGAPPSVITVEGKTMTPKEYLADVVKLKLDDYLEVMSIKQKPYYTLAEFEVPDNWWHSKEYHNVPLDDFMALIRRSVQKGHSLCIGGDTSEPGIDGHAGAAMIPSFDIPSEFINEDSRQMRFSNGTTEDNHGIHIVGFLEKNGKYWYLIKDSGSSSRNNPHPGYYFYHEDYVKLKMLGFTVHKEIMGELMKKFN